MGESLSLRNSLLFNPKHAFPFSGVVETARKSAYLDN
ncbi:hypothetical protein SAMN05444412_105234 [Rhodonellum ikkaensis]|uniref:Uncharacterized protein n=1 Tax=Rhodonellum ikkaensis TaxID=336829 RepID=A0A1H3Q5Y5_9BACT|nr:hypothetical protein SAMN05444412_105234 [Rhodonellum ikkaensis]